MSIYISHLYVEFYVELDINVCVVSFDLIDMIFDEKLLIGKSVDFFLGFLCLYRKKVVWIEGWKLGWEMGESVDFSGI